MEVCSFDNFHPHACGENCIHCRREQTEDHRLWDCPFCLYDRDTIFALSVIRAMETEAQLLLTGGVPCPNGPV